MKILIRSCLFLSFVLFLTSVQAVARLGPKDGVNLAPTDLERIKIGALAPDFTLQNHDGKSISLSDYRGEKNVVLVFNRGHW